VEIAYSTGHKNGVHAFGYNSIVNRFGWNLEQFNPASHVDGPGRENSVSFCI